jgi:hypothetical protein
MTTPVNMGKQMSREIDALVAEKIFGGKHEYNEGYGEFWSAPPAHVVRYEFDEQQKEPPTAPDGSGKHVRYDYLPNYSTNITEAFRIIKKFGNWSIYLSRVDDKWEANFEEQEDGYSFARTAETAPMAICLAALSSVAVEAGEK